MNRSITAIPIFVIAVIPTIFAIPMDLLPSQVAQYFTTSDTCSSS